MPAFNILDGHLGQGCSIHGETVAYLRYSHLTHKVHRDEEYESLEPGFSSLHRVCTQPHQDRSSGCPHLYKCGILSSTEHPPLVLPCVLEKVLLVGCYPK